MDHIDCIYYINLEHREDRDKEFLEEMNNYDIPFEKIVRIPGVYTKEYPALGCSKSHYLALEKFLKTDYKTCIIFEDDFKFSLDKEYVHFLLDSFFEQNINFTIVLLAGNILVSEEGIEPFIKRVIEAQTSSAYLITREYAHMLIQTIKDSIDLQENWVTEHGKINPEYCIDIYWKRLQDIHKWLIFNPKIGHQRGSYSDIEGKYVDYKV